MIVALVGGAYAGYATGYSRLEQSLTPDIQRLTAAHENATVENAALIAENEALRKALPSIAGKTVKIGYIAPETTTYETAKPFIEKVVQPDVNAYAESLGSDTRFEFVMFDAMGQANTHLEQVQELRSRGVGVFIGAGWSSQGCSSLSYVNTNNMLMFSPSSTSPTSAIAGDRFFRMCPADTVLPPTLANVIWSYGIRELVVIQRGDSWGDGIVNILVPEFTKLGGTVGQKVRYPAEATDFCDYLKEGRTRAQQALWRVGNDTSKVGVLLLAFNEASALIRQASQCEVLYNLVWFGGDATARQEEIAANTPLEANHLKLLSPLARPPDSKMYTDVGARYEEATGVPFDVYDAYLYDAAFAITRTILETGSDDAGRVAAALPGVCEASYGASGWLRLNEFGDRAPPQYDIWYYTPGVTVPSECRLAGVYDPDTATTRWNISTSDYILTEP